ncbi:MAG: ABC transporter permease [Conexivisphaerales archaeon]
MGEQTIKEVSVQKRRSATQWAIAWRRFRRNKSGLAGLAIVVAFVIFGVVGPFFAPYPQRSHEALYQGQAGEPPSWKHPFGTEPSGIDVYSDSIWSTTNDLYVAVAATLISVVIGILTGAIGGYSKGLVSASILAITQVFFVIPTLLLILFFARVFQVLVFRGFGLTLIVLILGLFGWPGITYVVRGQILSVRELEFVQAAKALGASGWRIMMRHIVPNVLTPVIVLGTLTTAGNILTEVVISFLGFGDPNQATWGQLISEGVAAGVSIYWWIALFPGLLTVLLVLGFNLLGDGLSDALNPRLRE